LPVPPAVAAECARVGALFSPDAAKRVAPELMHLTLAFIGWVPEDEVAKAASALRDGVSSRARLSCRLGEVGSFPTATRPRVVWIGLDEGADAVRDCALAVREALRAHGVRFDDKPPVAHLTVARVRDGIGGAAREAIASALRGARVERLRFDIDEAILFESRLARSGPTYIPVERVSLPPAAR
jgi:2'-5' RNA ligase